MHKKEVAMANQSLLNSKAAELQAQLTQWALENRVLDAGEEIVFSLRVEQKDFVYRDVSDTQALVEKLEITGVHTKSGLKWIAPAQLHEHEIEQVLGLLLGKARKNMHRLLILNSNNPIDIDSYTQGHFYQNANGKLRNALIGEKKYRLIRCNLGGNKYRVQLWECVGEARKY